MYSAQSYVAPYVGAWIETIEMAINDLGTQSHPMWVRGLKLLRSKIYRTSAQSHPMWVRGLKQICLFAMFKIWRSHPMWVRGLKPINDYYSTIRFGRTLCGCVD